MSEFRVGAALKGRDGEVLGHLDAVVINPVSHKVTHLVAARDRFGPRRLVGEDCVRSATPDQIEVDLDRSEFEASELFDAPDFNVPGQDWSSPELAMDPGAVFLQPFATPMDGWVLNAHERIPPGEVTVRRGSEVFSADGTRVGVVDEFLVDPADGQITHVVLREGHLRHRDVVVPVGHATVIEDDRIVLDLDLPAVHDLDHIDVKRHGHVTAT